MTLLCFLRALLASLVELHMGVMVLFKVYGIELNTMKNKREPREITFYCDTQFTGETTAHMELISITWHFEWILVTLELTTVATGGDYEIITVVP